MICSKGLQAHLPNYSYPQFFKCDSANIQWSTPKKPQSQLQIIHDCSRFVHEEDASYVAKNGEMDNHGFEDHQMANYHSMVNQLLQTPNNVPQMQPKSSQQHISKVPSNRMVPLLRADLMTVEQTAAWISMVGHVSGWDEADQYAQSFYKNNIWGWLLLKLTVDSLKSDLGIKKFGHRLVIISEIRYLHYGISGWDGEVGVDNDHNRRLRGYTSVGDTLNSISCSQMPTNTRRKVSRRQGVLTSNRSPMCIPFVGKISKSQLPQKISPNIEQSYGTRTKSTRASPDNPIRYKTFHKVKIRSGKSVRSADVGFLPKGTVVVINQVKGRSGRVVLQRDGGEFVKVGWVTLYTNDRQLLRKYEKKNQT